MGGCCDRFLFGDVANAVRVFVVPGHCDRVFFDERVCVAVDVGVNAEAEDVLVEGSHDAFVDVCTEGNGHAFVDGSCGKNTGGLYLVVQTGGLVQVPHKDVFVVADGDDGLKNKNPGSDDRDSTGASVGVFPSDAVVNFMHTDRVWLLYGCAI